MTAPLLDSEGPEPLPCAATPSTDSPSLSAQVYATLRERIIRGVYPGGSKLPEQRLAEDLNVSRVPLREAVHLLERDGFADSSPRRAAVVWSWTTGAVHDLFDVRVALEVAATELAARRVAQGGGVEAIEAALAAQERTAPDDALATAEASVAFHEAIVMTGRNELMTAVMRSVSSRLVWLFYLTNDQPGMAPSCDQHHDLLDAIRSGHEKLSAAIAFAHIERGRGPSVEAIGRL